MAENGSSNIVSKPSEVSEPTNNSDVTLISTDKGKIYAHKYELTTASPYFKKMFNSDAEITELKIPFDCKTTGIITNYMYDEIYDKVNDEIKIKDNLNEAESLLRAANFFQLPKLVDIICNQAEDYIIRKKQFQRLALWHMMYRNETIQAKIKNYMRVHGQDMLDNNLYMKYDAQAFMVLLDNWKYGEEGFCYDVEEMALKIVQWVQHDMDKRKSYTAMLFTRLPVASISTAFIKKHLYVETAINTNAEVLTMLLKSRIGY